MSLLLFAVRAGAAPAVDLQARLGLDGWAVAGRLSPLRLDLGASRTIDGTVVVSVPTVGTGAPITSHHAVHIVPGVRAQIGVDVLVADPRRAITVEVREGRSILARVEVPVGPTRMAGSIVAALTREAAGLEFLAADGERIRGAYITEADLPVRWQSLTGVDLLALRDLNPRALLPAQQQALLDWVASGGRLLVTPSPSLVVPSWLRPLLPARFSTERGTRTPGIPVPLARLVPDPSASVLRVGGIPLAVRGTYGRGVVEVWAFDAFAPAARAWPGRIQYWRALLGVPVAAPVAHRSLAEELPRTRPLPGSTQVALAGLAGAYIVGLRFILSRWGASRGGWVALTTVIVMASVVLRTFAAGARAAAATVAQVSVVEVLPGLPRAQVTTYLSPITPYGGRLPLTLPREAAVHAAAGPLLLVEPAHTVVTGEGQGPPVLEVIQVIPLTLRAYAEAGPDALTLVTEGAGQLGLRDALLYRGRHIYRLDRSPPSGRLRLDPTRWQPLARPAAEGNDLVARAMRWVLPRLESAAGDLWLIGTIQDERLLVRLPDGRTGDAAHLVLIPVVVRGAP